MSPPRPLRGVVVGARRSRQGIGPFVARALIERGARICGVVGTRPESAQQAATELEAVARRPRGPQAGQAGQAAMAGRPPRPAAEAPPAIEAHVRLEAALASLRPDFVALCSPYLEHRDALKLCAEAGCHVLCEKPLWWPRQDAEVDSTLTRVQEDTAAILDAFEARGLHLGLVTQWPFTLDAYRRLFPATTGPATRFEMELSPISTGPEMVLDAFPHPLSLLQAVVGPGEVEDLQVRFPGDEVCLVDFAYRHREGRMTASLRFAPCPQPPRPAAYSFDGRRADRGIELPEYRQYFEDARGARVELPDPLPPLAAHFLAHCHRGGLDRPLLEQSMRHLGRAWAAARRATAP